jgi:hypothetical protein
MKSLLRALLLNVAVIFFAALILPGLSYSNNFQILILTINVLMLYLVTRLIPGFSISAFHFDGLVYQGLTLQPMEVGLFSSYILSSFLISLLTSVLGWLFD